MPFNGCLCIGNKITEELWHFRTVPSNGFKQKFMPFNGCLCIDNKITKELWHFRTVPSNGLNSMNFCLNLLEGTVLKCHNSFVILLSIHKHPLNGLNPLEGTVLKCHNSFVMDTQTSIKWHERFKQKFMPFNGCLCIDNKITKELWHFRTVPSVIDTQTSIK
jgi:hypothetical protein